MPDNAPKVKRTAVEGYGGQVVECASNVKAREDTAARVVSETGATFIHPYDNRCDLTASATTLEVVLTHTVLLCRSCASRFVMAGQGTIAYELLMDYPQIDTLVVAVGGGGMVRGTLMLVFTFLARSVVF